MTQGPSDLGSQSGGIPWEHRCLSDVLKPVFDVFDKFDEFDK